MSLPTALLLERRNAIYVLFVAFLTAGLTYIDSALLGFRGGSLLLVIVFAAIAGLAVTQPVGRRLFMLLLLLVTAYITGGVTGIVVGY